MFKLTPSEKIQKDHLFHVAPSPTQIFQLPSGVLPHAHLPLTQICPITDCHIYLSSHQLLFQRILYVLLLPWIFNYLLTLETMGFNCDLHYGRLIL